MVCEIYYNVYILIILIKSFSHKLIWKDSVIFTNKSERLKETVVVDKLFGSFNKQKT